MKLAYFLAYFLVQINTQERALTPTILQNSRQSILRSVLLWTALTTPPADPAECWKLRTRAEIARKRAMRKSSVSKNGAFDLRFGTVLTNFFQNLSNFLTAKWYWFWLKIGIDLRKRWLLAWGSKMRVMRGKIDETITVATYLTCTLVLTRGRFFYIPSLGFCVFERAILGKIEGFETVFSRGDRALKVDKCWKLVENSLLLTREYR